MTGVALEGPLSVGLCIANWMKPLVRAGERLVPEPGLALET